MFIFEAHHKQVKYFSSCLKIAAFVYPLSLVTVNSADNFWPFFWRGIVEVSKYSAIYPGKN